MKRSFNYWIALHSDKHTPIGGVKQIHRLAEVLEDLGRKTTIIQESKSFHPGWFKSNVKTISLNDFIADKKSLKPSKDIIIMPETFLNFLPNYLIGLRKIIFNQNASYSFGNENMPNFPSPKEVISLYKQKEIFHTICVSRYDEEYLKEVIGIEASKISRLINGIETDLFQISNRKKKIITCMSRKNRKHSEVIIESLQTKEWFKNEKWQILVLDRVSHEEVARSLQSSTIFLSFGHPEGFGLPLAEAAACGCYLIGYSGLGGREILDIAIHNKSGKEIDFGDSLKFIKSCHELNEYLNVNQDVLIQSLVKTSKIIREKYSMKAMKSSIQSALEKWEAQIS